MDGHTGGWGPWLTPTESCESDGTEFEDVQPFRAPPGLVEPMHGSQTGVTTVVEEPLQPEVQINEGHKAV